MGDEETELEATIKSLEEAKPGDDFCWIIKGLVKQNMPRSGDVMVYEKDEFDAQIQVLDIRGISLTLWTCQ